MGLVAIERQGNKVYQRHLSFFDGHFIANAEREFYFAVTGQHAHPVRLELRVYAILKASYKNVYVNGKQLTSSGEPMFVSENFLSYGHSFPAPYDPNFFVAPFKIRLNGNEGDEYQFDVTVVDAITGEFLTFNINHVSIHKDKESEHSVIKSPVENDSVTSPFPGTTTVFLGAATTNFSRWRVGYDKIDNKYKSAIADMSITNQNSEITTLTLTTKYIDGLPDGGYIGYLTVYAANQYGYEVSRDLKVNVAIAPKYQTPVIDNPTQELSVLYGAAGETVFTGEYISTWSCDTTALPGFIQDVNLDYSKNRNKCKVNVMLSPDAAIGSNYDLKLTAYNGMNTKSAAATLKIKTVGAPEDYADPIIDDDETISVVQGGSVSAVFTGRYVKRWGYKGGLPDGIDDIKFNYGSNPNRCEIIVTAKANATVTTTPLSLNVYAYNAAGEEIKTPKTLYINILQNDKTATPVINETAKGISVVPGGTAAVTFTGQHTRNWSWEKANDNTTADFVENIELNYLSNPARCEVRVKVHDGVKAGLTDVINIYAYNAVGKKIAAPAKLTVKVASTGDNEDPKIDESETVSVIKGGTAKATFTGQHIRAWAYGTLPEAIHAIELKPAANPNRCDVLVTAADKTDATSAKITIYACNAIGEVTSADLNVIIIDDKDHSDPVIDCNESVRVIAGGTARAVFTGKHINSWKYGNLPDEIKAVELNYASNPNRCEVLVTASSTAAFGEKTVTIYAYNEIGEMTSANLNVTIIDTRDHSDPVIDCNESVSVIAGGTARAVFTGKHINSWKYGNLPNEIKAVELNYAANPNRCDVLVTASSKA
ncbi:MAG: hypothetical protein IJP88_11740, partial [Synergistaceae bacterium]|nr:hypothetical protein [Synergistaceae bacterium]